MDHWNRRDEDIKLAAGLGLNSYRFSLEWAKLEPEPGRWNEEAFSWYEGLLDISETKGLLPMLTIHHFTLPLWVAKAGGFANERIVEGFGRFTTELAGISLARRNEPQFEMGWAINPLGFGKVLKQAASFGLPIYVTENGIADKGDQLRKNYLLAHLLELSRAIKSGVDERGYFHWSLLDNFEWKEGFGPRFGLFRIDYSDFSRHERSSAKTYRKIIAAHGKRMPSQEILQRLSHE